MTLKDSLKFFDHERGVIANVGDTFCNRATLLSNAALMSVTRS